MWHTADTQSFRKAYNCSVALEMCKKNPKYYWTKETYLFQKLKDRITVSSSEGGCFLMSLFCLQVEKFDTGNGCRMNSHGIMSLINISVIKLFDLLVLVLVRGPVVWPKSDCF